MIAPEDSNSLSIMAFKGGKKLGVDIEYMQELYVSAVVLAHSGYEGDMSLTEVSSITCTVWNIPQQGIQRSGVEEGRMHNNIIRSQVQIVGDSGLGREDVWAAGKSSNQSGGVKVQKPHCVRQLERQNDSIQPIQEARPEDKASQ